MGRISVDIPGMDEMEPSRLINGVTNLTVVLQQVIPEFARSFVNTLDTITDVIQPLGNVTEHLAEISEKSKPGIVHLHKMAEGTVKLLDNLNKGLTPMQDISLSLAHLLDTTNKTMQVATLAIVILAILVFVISFALVGMCGLYYACYRKKTSANVNSKQEIEEKI